QNQLDDEVTSSLASSVQDWKQLSKMVLILKENYIMENNTIQILGLALKNNTRISTLILIFEINYEYYDGVYGTSGLGVNCIGCDQRKKLKNQILEMRQLVKKRIEFY
ncbi:hypothetical protein ABPG72_002606, partial [Tetrahymena utriculariae]